MNDLEMFCRQVRARSAEHRRAVSFLSCIDASGQLLSILRQELDSMIRVIYMLAQSDHEYRKSLIADSINGERWRRNGRNGHVTDREMVDIAQQFHGWTESVYKFGCGFIHLSNLHDHRNRDAFLALASGERDDIIRHLRHYHYGPSAEEPTLADIIPLLPDVFSKIASNLEYYIERLESGSDLEEHDD